MDVLSNENIKKIGDYPLKANQKGLITSRKNIYTLEFEDHNWEDYAAPSFTKRELHIAAVDLIRRILNAQYIYCIDDSVFGTRRGDDYFWFDVVQYGCNISMKDFLKMKRMPDFGDKSRKVIDVDIGDFYETIGDSCSMMNIQGDYGVRTHCKTPEQVCYRDVDLFRKGIQKVLRAAAKREMMLYEFLGGHV